MADPFRRYCTIAHPGTDETAMDFRRFLPEIRWQSRLSPVPLPRYRMAPVSPSPAIARTALSGKEWRVLILLLVSALINYIDRTTLSVAATDIQRELHLTNTQVGALQSAFFA